MTNNIKFIVRVIISILITLIILSPPNIMQTKSNFHIIGAGPTGLALAWYLSNDGHNVTIYEKARSVGGTWRTNFVDSYYSHHSPQIILQAYYNTFDLWKQMNIDTTQFLEPYKTIFYDVILKNTNLLDKIYIALGYIKYIFCQNAFRRITLSELYSNKLSDKGHQTMEAIAYGLDGVPMTTMTAYEFYTFVDEILVNNRNIYEMKLPSTDKNGYGDQMMTKLLENGVKFKFDHEVLKININRSPTKQQNKAYTVSIKINDKDDIVIDTNDHLILAMDPLNILKVINNSDEEIKQNWKLLNEKLNEGLYYPISIQIHFKQEIDIQQYKTIGNNLEWGIISSPLPSTTSSTNTLSCCVLNKLAYSSYIEKRVIECNEDEFVEEVLRQLKIDRSDIIRCTFSYGSRYEDEWKFSSSAAVHGTSGYLDPTGKLSNISIVSPINNRQMPITSMEAATEAAKLFCGKRLIKRQKLSNIIILFVVIGIILLCIIFL